MTTATAEKQDYVAATNASELFDKITNLLAQHGHQMARRHGGQLRSPSP